MQYSADCLKILANSQIQVSVEDFLPIVNTINDNYYPYVTITPEQIREYQVELITVFTDTIKETVKALNFPLLRTITFNLTQRQISFDIELRQDSTNDELMHQVAIISDSLNSLNNTKAEITHYLILLQHASNALESYLSPIDSMFDMDSIFPKEVFSSVKAKLATKQAILTAVEAPLKQIKQFIKDINSFLDNVVSSETNRLLRLESSIRLILNTRTRNISTFNGSFSSATGIGLDTL